MRRGLTGHFAPLSARDAAYLYDERPGRREMLVACYVFDAAATSPSCRSPQALREWMRARLGAAPFFTRRVRFAPLHLDLPMWVPVDRVDLDEHVHLHRSDGGWPALRDAIACIAAEPIDLRRPPWELHAVTGARFTDGAGAVTVIVLKVHHSAVDGMGVRALEAKLFSRDGAPEHRSRSSAHPAETAARAVLGAPVQALRFARGLAATRASDTGDASPSAQDTATQGSSAAPPAPPSRNRPATRFNAAVSGAPAFEIGNLPIADVRRARSAAPGATVNDVLLCAVGGALRRLLDRAGELPDTSLAALVPISLRLPDSTSGDARGLDAASANQLVLGTVDLRTDIADPAARLAAVAEASAAEKARWMRPEVRHARSRMDTAPAWLLALRGWAQGTSAAEADAAVLRHTMVSNLPAPSGDPVFDGAPLRAAFGILPVVDGDRIRHLFSTSGDRITLCVSADRDVLDDRAGYVASVAAEVASLRDATRDTPVRNR